LFNNHVTTIKQSEYQETRKKVEQALSESQYVSHQEELKPKSESLDNSSDASKEKFFDCQKYKPNTTLSPSKFSLNEIMHDRCHNLILTECTGTQE